ncbi:MAG: hypothetical protein MJ249_02650 [Kiritimatiellae bacterium]|nr:hypothetical protein [Kiritimatiellia bacterium]
MIHYLFISENKLWLDWQRRCFKAYVGHDRTGYKYHSFTIKGNGNEETVSDGYRTIAQSIEKIIEGESAGEAKILGVLDVPGRLCLREMGALTTVQGLLVLAFPEVLWVPVFYGFGSNLGSEKIWKKEGGGLLFREADQLLQGGFSPLFDGTGFRGALLHERKATELEYGRQDVAVVIDDERHFAFINSYTAFRFGYRVYPISTDRVAKAILSKQSCQKLPTVQGCGCRENSTLVAFEDVCVEFPDAKASTNAEYILGERREQKWPLLAQANLRVLMTVAYRHERIAELANGRKVRIGEYFSGPSTHFSELCKGGLRELMVFLTRIRRTFFNRMNGWWYGFWLLNLIEVGLVTSVLMLTLFRKPILFLPSLFVAFVILGAVKSCLLKMVEVFLGTSSLPYRYLKIRSQWKYYPKLFQSHCPQKQIHEHIRRYWCLVNKPVSGIFGLRNQCGLPNGRIVCNAVCNNGYVGVLQSAEVRAVRRNAFAGLMPTETGWNISSNGHSAPGKVLEVASDLLRRARRMKDQVTDVEGAICAAVLATCAYELLNHKTPTLAIEALSLRHYFEVRAECEFPGVRAMFDMTDRYIDIHNSMWQICRVSTGEIRDTLFQSGMAEICDDLSGLLRSHGKFEEAAFFSRKSRYMHRLLLPGLLKSLLAFPEWVVRSKTNFLLSVCAFLVAFLAYYHFEISSDEDWMSLFSQAYLLLFSAEPDMEGNDKLSVHAKIVIQAMRQLVLIHVGFLATLFYDFMNRK